MSEHVGSCLAHSEVLSRLTRLEEVQKDTAKDHERRIGTLEVNEGKKDEKIDNILEVLKELKYKVEMLIQAPVKKYNTLQIVVITSAINFTLSSILFVVSRIV